MSYTKSMYFEEMQKPAERSAESLRIAKSFLDVVYRQLASDLKSIYDSRDNESGKRRIECQIKKLNQFLTDLGDSHE